MMVRWLSAATIVLLAGSVAVIRTPGDAMYPLMVGIFAITGAVLAARRPSNSIGWIFLVSAMLMSAAGIADGLSTYAAPGSVQAAIARGAFAVLFFPGFTLVLVPLLLLFPDGRLPTRRWRWALWAAGAFTVLAAIGNALPEGSPLAEPMANAAVLPLVPAFGAGIAAVWIRYRRGDPTQRQQLKWFLLSAALLPIGVAVGDAFSDHAYLQSVIVGGALVPLPIAVAVAVLRFRLYEIDRIVSRTVTYAVVTALLLGIYLVVAILPSTLLRSESDLLVAGATLLAAAAFVPARRRVQTAVDRRFNRSRYDAARVVDGFATHLRQQMDLGDLANDLSAAVHRTVQPASVSLWLRPGGRQG